MTDDGHLRTGYAICGEARSGSSFLRRLIRSTGLLGDPWEFFSDRASARKVLRNPIPRLTELRERASTPNGVYGLKVFSAHFDMVVGAKWAERLPNLHFVHLVRRDLLGQAISLARALQTGQYKPDAARQAEPHFDARAISDCLARIAYGQARWECWFARNALAPLRLAYEDVVADPQRTIDALAAHIGLAHRPHLDPAQIDLQIQRDLASEAWRRLYLDEAVDPTYLDGGVLFSRFRRGGAFARWFLGPRARTRRS